MTETAVTPAPVHVPLNRLRDHRQADLVLRAAIGRGDLGELPDPLSRALHAGQRLDQLAQAVGQLPGAHVDSVVTATVHTVLDGSPVDPQAFEDELLRAAVVKIAHENDLILFSRMNDRVREAWRQMLTEHADQLLDSLGDQLAHLLDEAASRCADLKDLDLTDPAAVMGATKSQKTSFAALPALADRYNRLRVAQCAVLAAAYPGNPTTSTLAVREVWEPTWPDVFATGAHEAGDFDTAPLPPHDVEPVARLIAIAGRGDLWVPSVSELGARSDRIRAAIDIARQRATE